MTKKQRVVRGSISIILGILMLIAFILLGNKDWKKVTPKDSIKFSDQFPKVPKNNVFTYETLPEINRTLSSGTGIIFFGYNKSKWVQEYALHVNEVAKEMQIEEIMYFDIYHDRENNTKDYVKTVSLLKEHLPINDDGERIIKIPNLTIVKDGVILSNNNDTSLIYPTDENAINEYWTEENIEDFNNTIRQMFNTLKEKDLVSN